MHFSPLMLLDSFKTSIHESKHGRYAYAYPGNYIRTKIVSPSSTILDHYQGRRGPSSTGYTVRLFRPPPWRRPGGRARTRPARRLIVALYARLCASWRLLLPWWRRLVRVRSSCRGLVLWPWTAVVCGLGASAARRGRRPRQGVQCIVWERAASLSLRVCRLRTTDEMLQRCSPA